MSEQEQFEQWFENDTKGLDKASARAGWVERMAQESAELEQLRAKLVAYESQAPVAYANPQAFVNFDKARREGIEAGPLAREWMWASPGSLLAPLYASAAPARIVMPERLPYAPFAAWIEAKTHDAKEKALVSLIDALDQYFHSDDYPSPDCEAERLNAVQQEGGAS
ncbi:hypothetical protein [Pseudomonas sp. Marseille-QA0892]